MKKIIVLILLLIVVGFIVGGDLRNKVPDSNNTAQAAVVVPAGYPKITYARNQVTLHNPRGVVGLYAYFVVDAPQATTLTFGTPLIQKDGTTFIATTSNFKISSVRMVRKGFSLRPEGPARTIQPFDVKKGRNIYLVQWSVDSALLPVGTYKMSFSTYTATSSTTTLPIVPKWSNDLVITDNDYRALHGQYYRLESYNNRVWANASTAPVLAFREGRLQAQFCGVSEGIYQIVRNRLVSTLRGSQPNCGDTELNTMEKTFVRLVAYGLPETLSQDGRLRLNIQSRAGNLDMTFVKFTPTTIPLSGNTFLFPPRIYPCDFVGPLEAGAIRDCGLGLGVTPGGALAPTLFSLSPITVARGGTVIVSGANFASSTEVLFTGVSVGIGQKVAAVVTSTTTATSFQFVVPNTFLCPVNSSCTSPTVVQPGIYSVQAKTINGISSEGLTLIVQ